TFTGDPNNYDLSAVIFNLMVLHYANPGPNPNPNWNHDLFTVLNYRNGMAKVRLNGKDGFIDRNRKIIIPFKHARLGRIQNSMIKYQVVDNNKN
ncbi:MAG TPA: hypothetical protein VFM65_09410, partial [Flavobacteriaceae bacterium]|nr:hypothetical protein [Flavobacteriaceae bacterium]